MRLPIRFRVRTMMAIVAVVALGFGVTFELKNHAERDRLLIRQAECYRQAAIHQKRADECQLAEERREPYLPAERLKVLAADRIRSFLPPGGFRSWEAEMLDHLYWGERMYDQADSWDGRLKALESRLLLPVPTRR